MENRIDLRQYKEHFPDSGSVRINHCKEGESNRKFYLTRRDEDGIILGYCHHCGGSGSYRLAHSGEIYSRKKNKGISSVSAHAIGTDASDDSFTKWGVPQLKDWKTCERWQEPEFTELSPTIKKWWFSNNCSIEQYKSIGIKVLDGKTLAIPLFLRTLEYFPEDFPVGLALRPLRDDLPKWIILGSKQQYALGTALSPDCTHIKKPLLVLTEDYISALRCSRYVGAIPLMGVHLSDWHLKQVMDWYADATQCYGEGTVVVWLDNDSRVVKDKAKKIYQRLTSLIPTVILKGKKEAKHFINDSDLEEYIWKQI